MIDEEGQEVSVDPAELRAQKEKDKPATTKGKVPVDRRGRPVREPRQPSWQRAIRMGLFFVALLFVVTSFIGNTPIPAALVLAVGYGIIGIPFFYFLDRAAYRRWERATGRTSDSKR